MKHLKESILTSIGQGDRYFDELYKKYGLKPHNIKNNPDGTINYRGNVDFRGLEDEKLPFKFFKVTGEFILSGSEKLKTLQGCPKEVGRYFSCSGCSSLENLEGSPEIVKDNFYCINCDNLLSLQGISKKVGGLVYIDNCKKLISLGDLSIQTGGNFVCTRCGRKFEVDEIRKNSNIEGVIHVDKKL